MKEGKEVQAGNAGKEVGCPDTPVWYNCTSPGTLNISGPTSLVLEMRNAGDAGGGGFWRWGILEMLEVGSWKWGIMEMLEVWSSEDAGGREFWRCWRWKVLEMGDAGYAGDTGTPGTCWNSWNFETGTWILRELPKGGTRVASGEEGEFLDPVKWPPLMPSGTRSPDGP